MFNALNLTVVDGFCGGGVYRFGGTDVEGSPFRLLRAVEAADQSLKDARAKGFSIRADSLFVDENPEHISFLRDVLSKRGYGSRIGKDIFIECATFEAACPAVKLHWRLNDCFRHHGSAGFHALGFDPSRDLRQGLLDFMFDDDALRRSEAAVVAQLPSMIREANMSGGPGLIVENFFISNCNDTPVTSDILSKQLILLREEGELLIVGENGAQKPRSKSIQWADRLVLPAQRSIFSRL